MTNTRRKCNHAEAIEEPRKGEDKIVTAGKEGGEVEEEETIEEQWKV